MSEHEKKEMSDQLPNDYRYRWNYGDQCAYEKEQKQNNKRRGTVAYAVIMTLVFAICFAVLVGVVAWYGIDQNGGDMIASEVSEAVMPSTVLIYASSSTSYGFGTGFFIRSNGYIATNYHVIENKTNLSVTLYTGEVLEAKLIDYSAPDDLAVLKVQGDGFSTVTIGNSDLLRVGEPVFAIGNPSGADGSWSITQGIISALEREVSVTDAETIKEMTMIQTDAAVNPGNSGGPLCNARGEVIGIVNRKLTEYEGIGYAIPINGAMNILNTIVDTGSVGSTQSSVSKVRPTIGISVSNSEQGGKYYDVDRNEYTATHTGVFVNSVDVQGAANGHLKPGDIIIGMDGNTVTNQDDLRELLYQRKVGDEIELLVARDGGVISVKIVLGKAR